VLVAIGPEPSADSSAGALLGCVAMEATGDVRGPWEPTGVRCDGSNRGCQRTLGAKLITHDRELG